MDAPSPDILRANLAALRGRDPEAAALVEAATPAPGTAPAPGTLHWQAARSGAPTATWFPVEPAQSTKPASTGGAASGGGTSGGGGITLASKYDPVAEAAKLLASVDFSKTACVVLMGAGLCYHVEAAADSLGHDGLVLVYEPDVTLFRAVLEHRDLAALLRRKNVVWLLGEDVDRAQVLVKTDQAASLMTQGTQLVTLPSIRAAWAERFEGFRGQGFGQVIADVVAYARTNMATLLVNTARTCRNLAANLDVYAAGATTNELRGAAQGCVAVLVGAGPSLVKNVDLLRDPAIRRNVVVIAVQTTLKPLLDRGIQPDFVTALDYSPICAQFYEGLPELPGVTLVAEPKAHAAILDAFPGPVRVCQSHFNDHLLGDPRPRKDGTTPGLARAIYPIKGGATVAHLSLYLAQHLGCDPIVFIGQDLGFSDGLYYAPGTAVHRVWDCELGGFNTIEMMEWQRIVRMRGHLRRFDDIHGRPIFSDEQMLTYLKQFERDFAEAKAAGQTIIDATEGGMVKPHVRVMTLREALERHATKPVPTLPLPPRELNAERLGRLHALLRERLDQVRELRRMSRESVSLLDDMRRHFAAGDKARLDKAFTKLERNRKRVEGDLSEPFALVSQLNTVGTFRRMRADRAIAREPEDRKARFALQLERDRGNIEWIIQACDEATSIFEEAWQRVQRHDIKPIRVAPALAARGAA